MKNNDKLDWYMISEQMIYFYPLMAICCFHLKLSFLLPWFKSQVAKLTYGFPTIRMYFISSAIQTVELILVIAVLVLYAFYNGGLAELPFSILMSYYLTSGSAILFMFLSLFNFLLPFYNAHKILYRFRCLRIRRSILCYTLVVEAIFK